MALTERKRLYVEARLSGMPQREAALAAGCPEKSAAQQASRFEKDIDVLIAFAAVRPANGVVKRDEEAIEAIRNAPKAADSPITFFFQVMNDLKQCPKLRLEAAKSLARYSLEKPADVGLKKSRQDNANKSATSGVFSTPKPPKLVVDNK